MAGCKPGPRVNMEGQASDLAVISFIACAAGYGVLGVYLLRRGYLGRQAARVQSLMLAAVLASSAWAVAGAVAHLSAYTGPSFVASGLDLLRYAFWLAVLVLLLRAPRERAAGEARSASDWLAAAAVLVPLAAAGVLALRLARGHYEEESARMYLGVGLALPVLGLVLVEQLFRNLPEDSRWSAKPLCLALAGIFAFDVYMYSEAVLLARVDEDARSIRAAIHLLAAPLLMVAASRNTDWARSVQVSRRAVFYSATLLLAGGYLLFISVVGYYVRYFGGEWGRALQLGLLFAGVIGLTLLVLSASLRARVRVFVGKHFFSYRFDYREEWMAFTATLSSNSSPQEVGILVIRALANIVECPAGSLWARTGGEDGFTQFARWNTPEVADREPPQSPLTTFLRDKGWLIDLDEFRAHPQRYGELVLPAWLAAADSAWAVIPLSAGEDLLGFVVLARPRTEVELDWEVRDLLKAASRQAAGYLAQMRATEALLEARKFDAFNRMSAFVVHDLKNIVTQLSLMLKNAQRLHDNPEFQRDMLLTVESSLEKMRRLMLQLREGATPPGGAHGVALAAVAARLERTAGAAGRRLEVEIVDDLATRGHEDRLERVLGHLVQNAFDATPPDGRVWLRVQRRGGRVEVAVGDTGRGMTAEFVRTRLFKPFNSTKTSGMGIGSFESAQYIRELGGSIEVQSEPGSGTVVTVELPLFELHKNSDLRLPESS